MAPDASGAGSLVVAAPAGSYGTGTPQQPLTISSVSLNGAFTVPLGLDGTAYSAAVTPVLPPITQSYRLWGLDIEAFGSVGGATMPALTNFSVYIVMTSDKLDNLLTWNSLDPNMPSSMVPFVPASNNILCYSGDSYFLEEISTSNYFGSGQDSRSLRWADGLVLKPQVGLAMWGWPGGAGTFISGFGAIATLFYDIP